MTKSIQITDVNLAIRFARTYLRGFKGMNVYPAPSAMDHPANHATIQARHDKSITEILASVNRAIGRVEPEWVARKLVTLKGKAKHVSITGCVCSRCGAALSAPDSVAAGIGPECQTKEN